MTRRDFMATAAAAATAAGGATAAAPGRPIVCVFSKHLAKLDYDQLGRAAHELGFDGVDLTVRPGGHVVPERVAEDLPRAVEAIRSHGVEVPLITTAITSASDPSARAILSTPRDGSRFPITSWVIGTSARATRTRTSRACAPRSCD